MNYVLNWYFISLILAFINLPLTWRLFNRLPSRGIAFSRILGLLLWGYLFWLLASINLLRNDLPSQFTALFILLGVNLWLLLRDQTQLFFEWVKKHWKLIAAVEALFLAAFAFWALVRSANPEIVHTEKYMEMAFINAILRSPSFPPIDPWLSGYGISYYYFGYVLSAMLIRVSAVDPAVGYNLVSAFCFGMTASASHSLLFDLLKLKNEDKSRNRKHQERNKRLFVLAILAPLMLLIAANWHGALDVMHSRGLFWKTQADGSQVSDFWSKANLRDLTAPPGDQSWFPQRGWQWWAASRTVKDFNPQGNELEIIDEFPNFTFLLADIHPHMLGMPFVLLAIAQAMSVLAGSLEGITRIRGQIIPFRLLPILVSVVTLGGIAFMNTWDFPFYLVLIVFAIEWKRYRALGWAGRIGEFILLCAGLGIAAVAVYLPFYLSFASQAGGFVPSLLFFTQGRYFWIMFGVFLIPMMSYLIWRTVKLKDKSVLLKSALWTAALFLLLFVFTWGVSFLALRIPAFSERLQPIIGGGSTGEILGGALIKRLKDPWTLLALFAIISLGLSLLLKPKYLPPSAAEENERWPIEKVFASAIILLGALIALAPEFVYLRDFFGTRINTIFKFYFQAWILWSLAASYGICVLMDASRFKNIDRVLISGILLLSVIVIILAFPPLMAKYPNLNNQLGPLGSSVLDYLILLIPCLFLLWLLSSIVQKDWSKALLLPALFALAMGLVYPVIATWNKTSGFSPATGLSLDGMGYIRQSSPDVAAGIDWLKDQETGILAEAVHKDGGDYTTFNGISTFTGQPSILGWVGHEGQWRGGYLEVGSRQADLRTLYSTRDWLQAQEIISKYNIRYIYVGEFERTTYPVADEKFITHLKLAFSNAQVQIYEVLP